MANSRQARLNSINQNEFSYESHKKWFIKKIENQSDFIFIVFYESQRVGFIRLDKQEDFFLVSIVIDENFRGKKLASKSLNLLKTKLKSIQMVAYILPDNLPSIKAFETSGFQFSNLEVINERTFNIYTC